MDAAQTEKLKALARDLVDEEGENRAVRTFLMQYSCDRSGTVGAMLAHMNMSGWRGTAPDFALNVRPETHLTKAGAQIWLRHLFGLEGGNTNQVGCERDDGLLNIHAENETCEVCSAPAAGTDKDAERIDWFEKMLRERGAVWMMPSGEELRFVQVRTPGECWNGPTVSGLREAIDAAILAHTKTREGANHG